MGSVNLSRTDNHAVFASDDDCESPRVVTAIPGKQPRNQERLTNGRRVVGKIFYSFAQKGKAFKTEKILRHEILDHRLASNNKSTSHPRIAFSAEIVLPAAHHEKQHDGLQLPLIGHVGYEMTGDECLGRDLLAFYGCRPSNASRSTELKRTARLNASSRPRCANGPTQKPIPTQATLPLWLHRYHWHRPNGSLRATTPIRRFGLIQDNLLRLDILSIAVRDVSSHLSAEQAPGVL